MSKEKGFGAIGIILIVIAVGTLGFIGWKVWEAGQKKSNVTSNQQQQNQQNTPGQQTDPNEGYVVIKEWSVRFKPVAGLEGVEYFKAAGIESDSFTFTTKALAESSINCSASSGNIVLGLLARHTSETPGYGGVVTKIGEYYYQYRGPQATCGAAGSLESKAVPNLSQSLKSLEAAR